MQPSGKNSGLAIWIQLVASYCVQSQLFNFQAHERHFAYKNLEFYDFNYSGCHGTLERRRTPIRKQDDCNIYIVLEELFPCPVEKP